MSKKVLVISTSPRKGGNSEILAENFAKGAKEAGHTVEMICLHDKKINFCKGCFACQKTKHCVIKDDAEIITQKMQSAEIIAFATPVYFYDMCGQMKTLLDRTHPICAADYAFRDIYLLAAAGDGEEKSIDGTIEGLTKWVNCFKKAKLTNVVRGVNALDIGDILKNSTALKSAYEMGKNF